MFFRQSLKKILAPHPGLLRNSRQFAKFADENFSKKSAIKRDGPVFFFSAPVKVAGDENTEQEAADG